MSWNYRLVKQLDPDGTVCIAIHEVYYDDVGKPTSVTVIGDAVFGTGDSEAEAITDCQDVYKMMAEAFSKPVLDYTTF